MRDSQNPNPAAPTDGQPDADAKSIAVAKLIEQFKLDRELHQQFKEYIERDGRKLNKHTYRWLYNVDGRIIGFEEQWQFDVDQLWKFHEYLAKSNDKQRQFDECKYKHLHSYWRCRWCGWKPDAISYSDKQWERSE